MREPGGNPLVRCSLRVQLFSCASVKRHGLSSGAIVVSALQQHPREARDLVRQRDGCLGIATPRSHRLGPATEPIVAAAPVQRGTCARDQQPPVSLWFAGSKRQVRYNARVGGSDEDPLVVRLILALEEL